MTIKLTIWSAVLLATDIADLQGLLNSVSGYSESISQRLNVKKTKCLVVRKNNVSPNTNLKTGNEVIDRVII